MLRGRSQFRQYVEQLVRKHNSWTNADVRITEEGLREQLDSLDRRELKAQADVALQNANIVNEKFNEDRQTGSKKVGAQAQSFIESFSGFLNAYSGIISVVRGGGQQYGELAYETLSLLLIVCTAGTV